MKDVSMDDLKKTRELLSGGKDSDDVLVIQLAVTKQGVAVHSLSKISSEQYASAQNVAQPVGDEDWSSFEEDTDEPMPAVQNVKPLSKAKLKLQTTSYIG
ncbi:hypothetical protein J4219_04105 [Candidatus Woesearchaeota archaeon]|nr:hypothetical protein [Candidatus Woesearchaeota archaeon]